MKSIKNFNSDATGKVANEAGGEDGFPSSAAEIVEDPSRSWIYLSQHSVKGMEVNFAVYKGL